MPVADKKADCFVNGLQAIEWKYSSFNPAVVHDGTAVNNFGDYNKMKQGTQIGCALDKQFPV